MRPSSASLRFFFFPYKLKIILRPLGIDKITEKAQVSEDGTMVAVLQPAADGGAAAGASDTESNSERDHEVREASPLSSLFFPAAEVISLMLCPVSRSTTSSPNRRGVACRACRQQQRLGAQIQTGLVEICPRVFCNLLHTEKLMRPPSFSPVHLRCCCGRQSSLCRPS